MIYTFQLHRTVHNMSKKQIQTHLPALAKRMLYSNKFPHKKKISRVRQSVGLK